MEREFRPAIEDILRHNDPEMITRALLDLEHHWKIGDIADDTYQKLHDLLTSPRNGRQIRD